MQGVRKYFRLVGIARSTGNVVGAQMCAYRSVQKQGIKIKKGNKHQQYSNVTIFQYVGYNVFFFNVVFFGSVQKQNHSIIQVGKDC